MIDNFSSLFLISLILPFLLKNIQTGRPDKVFASMLAVISLAGISVFLIWPDLREFYSATQLLCVYAAFGAFSLIVGLFLFAPFKKGRQST